MQMTDAQRRTFEFRECLGRGGFGEVYLAKMTVPSGLSSTVAVKVLHAGLDPRSQGLRRLMDEGKILSLLNHPAIVGVHDLAIIEGRIALVTEFIEGADLGDCMVGDDPIPNSALYEAFAGVADALHAAHLATDADGAHLGLLHRDVKPGNIRIGRHGQVKLLDFGIATSSGMDREAQTGTNALIGSFAYMPPERFRRQPMEPSGDFYSLGCALFECLCGEKLFHLEDLAALLGPKTDPKTASAFYNERFKLLETHSDAADLIRSMVAVNPKERPTGPAIIAALEDLASAGGGPRLARWARAHEWNTEVTDHGTLSGQLVIESSTAASDGSEPGAPKSETTVHLADDSDTPSEYTLEAEEERPRRAVFFLLPLLLVAGAAALVIGAGMGLLFLSINQDSEVVEQPVPTRPNPVEPQPVEPTPTPQPNAPTPQPTEPQPTIVQPVPGEPQPVKAVPVEPAPVEPDPNSVVVPTESGGVERCGPLATLELKAASGTLGASTTCLSRAMRDPALSQTQREKLGRMVLVDAASRCAKGDCRTYEQEQPYFFEAITRSDAEMMYRWAKHQQHKGRHSDARMWANRALERKSQWTGSAHVKRVDALMGIRAHAQYDLWSASPKSDKLRNQARTDAAAWANYRSQIGKNTKEPMDMCVSAAGSAEVCNARVRDAVAKTKVVFVSVPPGSTLTIDDKQRGTTPLEVELSFGTHSIELNDSGSQKSIEVGTSQPTRWTWNEQRWSSAF